MYLTLIQAVWAWGMERGHLHVNPWQKIKKVKKPPKPEPKLFTEEEIRQILKAFEGKYYQNFVWFLLGVGCRIGEAAAIQWDALNDDCSDVWIGIAWDLKGRKIKDTKNRKVRTIPASPSIQRMLREMKDNPDRYPTLVFPAPNGGYIDRKNFLKQHWKPTLEGLGIEPRTTYNLRHSRWSHEIADGMDIATAAQYAGNSPRTMMERYYGSTKRPRLKDLGEDGD
jgi:integrase